MGTPFALLTPGLERVCGMRLGQCPWTPARFAGVELGRLTQIKRDSRRGSRTRESLLPCLRRVWSVWTAYAGDSAPPEPLSLPSFAFPYAA